jgi:hypothetical protein
MADTFIVPLTPRNRGGTPPILPSPIDWPRMSGRNPVEGEPPPPSTGDKSSEQNFVLWGGTKITSEEGATETYRGPYCFGLDLVVCSWLENLPFLGKATAGVCKALTNILCLIIGIGVLLVLIGILLAAFVN